MSPILWRSVLLGGGGRQVGKTTVLKQWMADLVQSGVPGKAIQFLTGELIDNHHSLLTGIQQFLEASRDYSKRYLIVDEVTYIKDWTKAVKFAADAGLLDSVILVLTGSDLAFLKEGLILLPGRRGVAEQVDFHLHPLSFRDLILLKHSSEVDAYSSEGMALIDREFENYFLHGGFLTAINDCARSQRIEGATLRTYSDWILGDLLKKGKQETYLREILSAVVKHLGSQVSWNALSKSLSIDHPQTVAEYIDLLARMDCLYIQSALLEDKLTAAPKKAKKLVVLDPFIWHTIRYFLMGSFENKTDFFEKSILPILSQPETLGSLVENTVVSHYRRLHPTYYIKAEGEVDLAVVSNGDFQPIQVKWTEQIRSKDLKQIQKYKSKNPLILTKHRNLKIEGIQTEHLPTHLFNLKLGT